MKRLAGASMCILITSRVAGILGPSPVNPVLVSAPNLSAYILLMLSQGGPLLSP